MAEDSTDESKLNQGPLVGVRVIELATVIMAPYATQILADLGADVIKVEGDSLDPNRTMGRAAHEELSGVSLNLHRNKRSIKLDLKKPAGLRILLELVVGADIFVTNMRPRALSRLGLDYATLAQRQPDLIYCEAHGFSTSSDEAERPVYDDIIQSETGAADLLRMVNGEAQMLPLILADKVAGLTIAYAVLGALYSRLRTGHGQRLEVPMFDAVLSFNLVEHLCEAAFPGRPAGYSRILTRQRGPHKTTDGYVAILPYSDEDWRKLYTAVGKTEELSRPEFKDNRTRRREAVTVYGSLAAIVAERSTDDWIELCNELGIAAARVPTLDEIVEDPRCHRGVISILEHPVIGPYRSVAPSVQYDQTPLAIRRHAPIVGQHTAELLSELGFGAKEISRLLSSGAATQSVPQ